MEFETKKMDILQGKPERFLSSFAQDAIIQLNEHGLIVYWNKSAERLFGLSEADVLNKNFHLLFAPERYLEAQKNAFAKFRISGEGAAINKTLEFEGKRKNGEEFPLELSLSSFQVNGKWNAVGIIRDISKRKRIEQKLRDSEEELRNIFDNVNDAIYIRDLKGNFIDVNATACKRLGYEKKEFLQMHIRDINTPENIAKNPKLFSEKLSLVKDVVETVHVTKSGKKIPVEIHGKLSFYQNEPVSIAVSRDITNRKKIENKIKERLKELTCLYDHSKIIEEKDITKEEILKKSVNLIPPAWQYPDITCARIIVDSQEYKTKNFKETEWKQTTDIFVNTNKVGLVEVYYLEKMPEFDEGPFLKEERYLINAMAERLGKDIERIEAEIKVKESEEWLYTVLQSIGDAVIATDSKGNVIFLNSVAESLTGWKQSEAIRKPVQEIFNIINEESREEVESPIDRVIHEGVITGLANNTVLISKDGREIPIDDSGAPIKDKEGKIIGAVLIFRDITERKKAEKISADLAKFPSENPNSILRVDKEQILYANKAGETIFNISPGDTIPTIIQEDVNEAFSTSEIKTIEIELNNNIYSFDINPIKEEDYANIYGKNITERRKADDKLRESEEKWRSLTEYSSDNILTADLDYNILFINQTVPSITKEEVIGQKLFMFIPEEFHESVNQCFKRVLKSSQPDRYDTEYIGTNGSKTFFEARVSPRMKDGEIIGFTINGIDITERKRAEDTIKERIKELTCLYELSKIAGEKKFNVDSFLKKTINLFPPAWQFPSITCARIQIEGKEYKTDNYKETEWHQIAKIYIEKQKIGEIEVGYLEETPIFDEGPFLKEERNLINGISEILSGVLELKLTEEKLKQSEANHRDMINNLDAAFYQVLLDGKLLTHNPAYNLIFGYEPSLNLKNTNVEDLWENPKLREVYLKQLLKDDYVKNYICHVLKEDGTKIVLQLNSHLIRDKEGRSVRIDGTFIDITEKFALEQKLIESEEKYRLIFENANDAISILNLEGNFYEVNNLYCTRLGYTREEIMKLNVRDLEIPESADLISDRLLEAREKGFNVIETAHRAKDGRIIPVEISCRSILYNKKPAILTIARDITERKKSERLKEKFTEHLEREVEYRTKDLNDVLEKQRLYLDQIEKSSRFKTEFLATMSHELRTPLNAIIGFTDLLIEGVFGELNKEQSEYINDIEDSSHHLLDMITRILDISKIESGQATLKIEEIQLNNLIAQVISTLKPLYIEKDIKWELVGLKKAQFIFADRIKFKQIIYNLLSNAIKFTKKGKIIFEFKENKYDWEFAIKDTGIGISENDFDIIFKDFKRVKSEYVEATQGIGLGLALTKRLVNLQGGDISFSSKLKKGTTFTFNLPKTIKEKLANLSKIESFLNKL